MCKRRGKRGHPVYLGMLKMAERDDFDVTGRVFGWGIDHGPGYSTSERKLGSHFLLDTLRVERVA
jgi:hypothetical protein